MKYNQQMEKWIITNYPLFPVKESLSLFNKTFNCDVTYYGYQKKAKKLNVLRGKKTKSHHRYTDEEINYIKLIYPNHSLKESCNLFMKKFGHPINYNVMSTIAYKYNIKGYRWTKEEKEWLKRNASNYTYKELLDLFNITFDRNKKLDALKALLNKRMYIYCKTEVYDYTEEENKWLQENYNKPEYNRTQLTQLLNDKFNMNRTENSVHSYCIRKGYTKDKELYNFKKNNIPWNTGISKEEHKKHFTKDKFNNMISTYKCMPNHKRRIDYEKEHNIKIEDDMALTDVGGELILTKRRYVMRATTRKLNKSGELTKLIYKLYEAEDLIKEKENKRGEK